MAQAYLPVEYGRAETREFTREWYAVQVYAGKEKWVTAALEERGHDPLLLLYTAVRQWSDRKMRIDRPVFPGYVLCGLDLARRASVLTTPGVLRIIGAGRTPIPLEHAEVFSLMRIAEAGYCVAPAPYLRVGTPVVVRGGSLDGVTGRVVAFRNRLRVLISISLLERAVALELDAARLEPLHSSDSPSDRRASAQLETLAELGLSLPVKRYKALRTSHYLADDSLSQKAGMNASTPTEV